jgi:hypothetical protein
MATTKPADPAPVVVPDADPVAASAAPRTRKHNLKGAAMTALNAFKAAARPFGIYIMTFTVAGAIFTPWVGVEKIALAVTVLGTLSGLRTLDKKITGSPNP